MYGYDPYSKMMQMAGGQGNIDYSQQQVGQDMGNFNPEANSGNDGLIGSILSKALSSYGPVGGAVGGAIGAVLDSGGKVGQNGEDRGLSQSIAKGAEKGAINAFANESLSSPSSSPSLGDAYTSEAVAGQALANSPSIADYAQAGGQSLSQYPTSIPSSLASDTSFAGNASGIIKDGMRGASKGLIGGTYDSMPDKGSFSANFRQGFKGGDASNLVGNLREGNFGSAIGQGTKFVTSNYKPPAYDADKYKQKYMIRY